MTKIHYERNNLASIMRAVFALLLDDFPTRVPVKLTSAAGERVVAYVDGELGLTAAAGDGGDTVDLIIDHQEYSFSVPAWLAVSKEDIVLVDVTDLSGHLPNDSAYSMEAGTNRVALCRAVKGKDANNNVQGILLPEKGKELFWQVQGITQKLRKKIQMAYDMQFKKKFGKKKIQPGVAATVRVEQLAMVVMGMVEAGDSIKALLKVTPGKLLKTVKGNKGKR